ncbi:MAG: hypothetical protein LUD46_05980 [Parabacteroides sp.]|nr:hypothetical protein [Parabacteroides sp.]
MNKKFSTLVAVLLAAGAWTTLSADVVVKDAPATGEAYAIGTALTGQAVTLALGEKVDAEQGDLGTNTVASTAGKAGLDFAGATQWTFVGDDLTSATMKMGETNYFLCYDASQTKFYLGESTDQNVVTVKVAEGVISIVTVGSSDDLAGNELSIADGTLGLEADAGNGTTFKL